MNERMVRVRYVVMALYKAPHQYRAGWAPVVVGVVPRRPWVWGESFAVKGQNFLTWTSAENLRDPHIEEVPENDPLLLGPFVQYGPDGVQHYHTLREAERNLGRLLLFAARKKPSLRSSVGAAAHQAETAARAAHPRQ
jgi:hypothetical protein